MEKVIYFHVELPKEDDFIKKKTKLMEGELEPCWAVLSRHSSRITTVKPLREPWGRDSDIYLFKHPSTPSWKRMFKGVWGTLERYISESRPHGSSKGLTVVMRLEWRLRTAQHGSTTLFTKSSFFWFCYVKDVILHRNIPIFPSLC